MATFVPLGNEDASHTKPTTPPAKSGNLSSLFFERDLLVLGLELGGVRVPFPSSLRKYCGGSFSPA